MSTLSYEGDIPESIINKINQLDDLLDEADSLHSEITDWYYQRLQTIDPEANDSMEIYDPGNGETVEGISRIMMQEAFDVAKVPLEMSAEKQRLHAESIRESTGVHQ